MLFRSKNITRGSIIHTLAARGMIRDWEDGNYHSNGVLHNIIKRERKQDIISLSMQYSLLSKFTSFGKIELLFPILVLTFIFLAVAIEERKAGEATTPSIALDEFLKKEDVDELSYISWEQPASPDEVSTKEEEEGVQTFQVKMKLNGRSKPENATIRIHSNSIQILDSNGRVAEEHAMSHLKRWSAASGSFTFGMIYPDIFIQIEIEKPPL